jgi:hypothetical protein
LLEDILLETSGLKDHIKAEIPLLLSGLFVIGDNKLASIGNDIDDGLVAMYDLILGQRPASDCDFDALLIVGHLKFSEIKIVLF